MKSQHSTVQHSKEDEMTFHFKRPLIGPISLTVNLLTDWGGIGGDLGDGKEEEEIGDH
jgi:hypothetical protein